MMEQKEPTTKERLIAQKTEADVMARRLRQRQWAIGQRKRCSWGLMGVVTGILLIDNPNWLWIPFLGFVCLWLGSGKRNYKDCLIIGLVCLIMGAVCAEYSQNKEAIIQQKERGVETIEGMVVQHQESKRYLWLEHTNGFREKWYVQLRDDNEWYPAGTKLRITGTINLPEPQRNPGGFDQREWLRQNGAYRIIAVNELEFIEGPHGKYAVTMHLQNKIKNTIKQCFHEKEQGIILAILFGEKQLLEDDFYRKTQRLGIAHVFAVSGMHVGLVAMVFLYMFRVAKLENSYLELGFLMVALYGYCLILAFPPSIVRASCMLGLAMLGKLLMEQVPTIEFLALIAGSLLMTNPYLMYSVGFQLSFAVTGTLILFAMPIQLKIVKWGIPNQIATMIATAIAAWLGSSPIMIAHFYYLSVFSPFANIIIAPIIAALIPLMVLFIVLGCIWVPAGVLIAIPCKMAMFLIVETVNQLDKVMNVQWNIGGIPKWVLFIWAVWMIVSWICLCVEDFKWKRSFEIGLSSLLVVSLCACHFANVNENRIIWLYAGQGSCAILQDSKGEVIVFDCGSSDAELLSVLRWMGINKIKAVVLSHTDQDHIAGLMPALETIPISAIFSTEEQLSRASFQKYLAEIERRNIKVIKVNNNQRIVLKIGELLLYRSTDNVSYDEAMNENELVAIWENKQETIVFPGDIDLSEAMQLISRLPRITVWTVPHHGSRNSASEAMYRLLKQKGLKMAIISSGVNNRYGHPHKETLEYLAKNRVEKMRTDERGAIFYYY